MFDFFVHKFHIFSNVGIPPCHSVFLMLEYIYRIYLQPISIIHVLYADSNYTVFHSDYQK